VSPSSSPVPTRADIRHDSWLCALQGEEPAKRNELRDALMLSIPTVFDLIATVLMNIGMLSVTASVYQMMRGAEMVFAAVLAITCLKRSLNRLHYLGILACIGGIVLVGLSSVLSGEGGSQIQVRPIHSSSDRAHICQSPGARQSNVPGGGTTTCTSHSMPMSCSCLFSCAP